MPPRLKTPQARLTGAQKKGAWSVSGTFQRSDGLRVAHNRFLAAGYRWREYTVIAGVGTAVISGPREQRALSRFGAGSRVTRVPLAKPSTAFGSSSRHLSGGRPIPARRLPHVSHGPDRPGLRPSSAWPGPAQARPGGERSLWRRERGQPLAGGRHRRSARRHALGPVVGELLEFPSAPARPWPRGCRRRAPYPRRACSRTAARCFSSRNTRWTSTCCCGPITGPTSSIRTSSWSSRGAPLPVRSCGHDAVPGGRGARAARVLGSTRRAGRPLSQGRPRTRRGELAVAATPTTTPLARSRPRGSAGAPAASKRRRARPPPRASRRCRRARPRPPRRSRTPFPSASVWLPCSRLLRRWHSPKRSSTPRS